MMNDLLVLAFSMFLVIKGATLSTKYAVRLAESFKVSKYLVGLIVVAVISILPESLIVINSALAGVPDFGLGTLFGSNVADMTLLFTVVVFFAGRGIRISGKIIKDNFIYPLLLIFPLVLGADGYFSRLEGVALVLAGGLFYYMAFKNSPDGTGFPKRTGNRLKNMAWLLFGMSMLLGGAHFTVTSATSLARDLGVNDILIGMMVVGLGTIMPELFFALKSVKNHSDSMAVGDVLGTVLADATLVVGVLAIVSPFAFPQTIIFVTGVFMVLASVILFYFMRTGRVLTKNESYALFLFWAVFVVTELLVNR